MNLGIEIGGTKLQLLLGNPSGKPMRDVWKDEVSKEQGAAGIRLKIESAVTALLREHTIERVGVGFGGPVNRATGCVCKSHQIEGWSEFPLAEWLRELTGAPVAIENDANTAALGEARCGAGAGFDPVFYVTLGSGVGGGLVVDGQIYHGATPSEAEIGHLRIDRSGATVESRCSGWAVDKRVRRAVDDGSAPRLAQLAGDRRGAEAKLLAAALAEGDPPARRILEGTAADLAFALSHVIHLLHPEVIVLGGGLAQLGEPLRAAVEAAVKPWLMEVLLPGPVFRLAGLGELSVPVGALLLAGEPESLPCSRQTRGNKDAGPTLQPS